MNNYYWYGVRDLGVEFMWMWMSHRKCRRKARYCKKLNRMARRVNCINPQSNRSYASPARP